MKIVRLAQGAWPFPPLAQPAQAPQRAGRFKCPDLRVGDAVMVGKYKNTEVTIAAFGLDENNQPTIISGDGIESKVFSFRIKKLMPRGAR